MNFIVDKPGIVKGLERLTDYAFQKKAWLSSGQYPVSSIEEDYCYLFDNTNLFYALEYGQSVFGEPIDKALRDVHNAIRQVKGRRPPKQILDDPLMQAVRAKAAEVLRLIGAANT